MLLIRAEGDSAQLHQRPKSAERMDAAQGAPLAYLSFPPQHRTGRHSANPLAALNLALSRIARRLLAASVG